ncbi:MAG TPA: hypothetical protein VL331_07420 [Croceibacterium sp.]|jgi:hypothetical protein|nr:hypothetical protein [Croceibacterium sp.]
MRKVVPILALAALSACGQSQPAGDTAAAAEPPAATAPHSNAAPGTYVRTAVDGSMTTIRLQPDGTYSNWVAGAQTETGKWAVKNDKTCFTPDGGKEQCSSDGPIQPDGRFRVTPDQGAAYTLTKTA